VVGTKDGDKLTCSAVNWLTQASFAPPLVVFASKAGTGTTDMIINSSLFCVNVLETGSKDLASKFFRHVEPEGNKFGDVEFSLSPNGLPVLKDALGYFECKVSETYAQGDHTVFVAEVVEAGVQREGQPMTLSETGFFYGG
jgi:flavin reductase (DIM6/NTAB) family NADH-FMN oxidoreductase RutF